MEDQLSEQEIEQIELDAAHENEVEEQETGLKVYLTI